MENTRGISGRPKPPRWLVPRDNPGEGKLIDELIEDGATMDMLRIFRYLDRACERYHDPGTWVSQKTIAEALGIGRSTVRVYLKWLEERGYIARSTERVYGRASTVIWCLWLLPSGRDDHAVVIGEGTLSDRPTPRWPRKSRPAEGLNFAPGGAEPCAQDSAPKNRKWISDTDPSASASAAAPGEITEEPGTTDGATAVPNPAEQVFTSPAGPRSDAPAAPIGDPAADPLPAVAVLSADQVEQRLADLRNPRSPLRKLAYWALEETGQLPAEFAGLFPSRKPEPASRPAAFAVAGLATAGSESPLSPTSSPAPAPAAKADTGNLIRRLASAKTDDERDARVEEIARRLGKLWDEGGSINGFKPRLRQAAAGDIPIRVVLKAFSTAANAQPGVRKGAIFHTTVNNLLGDGA